MTGTVVPEPGPFLERLPRSRGDRTLNNFSFVQAKGSSEALSLSEWLHGIAKGPSRPEHVGHFLSQDAIVHRYTDRVLVGEAAVHWGAAASGVPDSGDSWLSDDSDGPAYLGVHAHLLVTTHNTADSGARYAIVGAALTSAETNSGGGIGVSGAIINRKSGTHGWAFYSDVQAEAGVGYSYGMEIAAKNASGADVSGNAYGLAASVIGIWLAAGGDNAYGPAATDPSAAAIVIGKNAHTWNTGLIFRANGLTGTDGTAGSSTYATAIDMARNHDIVWTEPTNQNYGAKLRSKVTTDASRVMIEFADDAITMRGSTEVPIFTATYLPSSQNYIGVVSAATTAAPSLQAAGTDTNIDLRFTPKGSGVVRFGTHAALGGESVTGYITIRDDGGTLRKLAVVS